MNTEIKDKVIAITGASSGIGEAIARHLAAQGAKVALGARRQGHLEKLVGEIVAAGGQALALAVDVTKRDEVEAFAEATVKNYGRLDVFINNAGLMPLSPLAANKVEEWERMVDVNIKGVLYGIAAALPRFQLRRAAIWLTFHRWPGMSYFLVVRCIAVPNSPCGPSQRAFGRSLGRLFAGTIISPARSEERTSRSCHRCRHSGGD